MKTVSIITLTRDKCQLVSELAASMEVVHPNFDDVEVEWIVIDNGSDGTEASLRNICKKTKLRYFKHDNSGNFSRQNNWAASMAQGEYLLFLNNDTRFLTQWFWFMLYLEHVPNVGVVGAVMMYPDFKIQHCGVCFQNDATPFNLGYAAAEHFALDEKRCHPQYWPGEAKGFKAVTGAFLGMRASDFRALGGFDETFSWCFEDVDLCLRAYYNLGLSSVCSRDICLVHYESQSGGDRGVQSNLDAFRGRWHGRITSDLEWLTEPLPTK